jgi:membrane protease YdiL (CAAX protease family)
MNTDKPGMTRSAAALDIILLVAAGIVFYGIEELLRAVGLFPFPAALDGVVALIATFFAALAIMKRSGQSWHAFGLRSPRRWWSIPAWALAVLVVNLIAQNTLVPWLSGQLGSEPPDFSRYDVLYQNLPMLLLVMPGAMITGGFMEEFIYRGIMIDRLGRLFGGGRTALLLAALLNGLPFGIIHFEWGMGGILLTTVMGSVLGLMYLATGRNLWPLVVAHATLDAMLMIMLYSGISP